MAKIGKDNFRFKNRVGEKHITSEGYEIEIIKYFNNSNCVIQFEDNTVVENVQYIRIKKGNIKNPNNKSVYGVGFIGVGKYKTTVKGKQTQYYNYWVSMLTRGYNNKYKEKFPTYKDVTVCEEWKCFQVFAEWFEDNYKSHMEGWELDKDVLFKGNKVYSPETCCFVPNEINSLFIKSNSIRGDYPIGVHKHGCKKYVALIRKNNKRKHIGLFSTPEEAFQAYKITKEEYIKEVADKWRDLISDQVYEAMYNYQVEITD